MRLKIFILISFLFVLSPTLSMACEMNAYGMNMQTEISHSHKNHDCCSSSSTHDCCKDKANNHSKKETKDHNCKCFYGQISLFLNQKKFSITHIPSYTDINTIGFLDKTPISIFLPIWQPPKIA